jgi:hypothetical protein
MDEIFVNRDEELALISDAVSTLQRQQLLRTPIIEFHGVQGIGKTMLLRHIEQQCNERKVSCVWADLAQKDAAITSFVTDARAMLDTHRPVVMILDSLDATTPAIMQDIETGLRELIENSFLFVVLASRYEQRFISTRSIARKLVTRSLQPIGRADCGKYLNEVKPVIKPHVREIIFEWTGGYPLAMNVMTDAIVEKQLDPTLEQDQKPLIAIMSDRIINQKLFSAVSAPDLMRYQTLFSVLSVPRRFNLALMQDLVEAYASPYSLASSIAYISLPSNIGKAVSALSWDLSRSGYCIEAPVRKLFLLKLKIEQPQLYQEIHHFLAEKNKSFVQEVSGTDRVHYLREFFYHLAHFEQEEVMRQMLAEQIEQLMKQGSVESLIRFYEEFRLDEDLQEVLTGNGIELVLSLFLRSFLRIYRFKNVAQEERSHFLREIFLFGESGPKADDFAAVFEEKMLQIVQQETPEEVKALQQEFVYDEVLKVLLGQEFDAVLARIFRSIQEEGA